MKIILNKDVKNLGEEGDVCTVKDGYARNFLLPQRIAVAHNRLNINNFKAKELAITARKEQKRKEALGLKERLEKEISIEIVMPSAYGGRLFGAVTNATIAEQLAHQGIDVERKRIEIPGRVIKVIGSYTVKIRLYNEQTASLKLLVRSLEEEKRIEDARLAEIEAESLAALVDTGTESDSDTNEAAQATEDLQAVESETSEEVTKEEDREP